MQSGAAKAQENGEEENSPGTSDREENGVEGERTCTGILTSHPQSRDIHFEKFTLLFHGHMLLEDTDLELNFGRYGLPSSARNAVASDSVPHQPHH